MQRRQTISRQKLKDLYKALNTLCNKLDIEYDINCGGCCYVTYCIAHHLYKHNIPYKVTLFYVGEDEEFDPEIAFNNIKNRYKNCCPTGNYTTRHYAIRLPGIGIINKGHTLDYDHKDLEEIYPNDLIFIYKNGSWNDFYDTKYNKMINTEITKVFKKYEKEFRHSL